MSKQERKRKTSLGVLFWIAAILLILVVFLFNRRNIEQVMEDTGLVEVINQRIGVDEDAVPGEDTGAEDETRQPANSGQEAEDSTASQGESGNSAEEHNSPTTVDDGPSQTEAAPSAQESEKNTNEETSQDTQNTSAQNSSSSETENYNQSNSEASQSDEGSTEQDKERQYTLYMVHLEDSGDVSLAPIQATVSFISSPLTRTLETLISQPQENSDGSILNLIPEGSRILRIWIEDRVAFIDMNEDFRFNPMGSQGLHLQLAQLVTTACQFDTVDAVQILIEGEKVEFLGGDGIYIGEPISPQDF